MAISNFLNYATENPLITSSTIVSFGAVIAGGLILRNKLNSSKKWKKVGKVDQLCIYPLKSGKVVYITSAEFQKIGIQSGIYRDREFCIINDSNKEVVKSTTFPHISQLEIGFFQGKLRLQAFGMDDIIIEDSDLIYNQNKEVEIIMGPLKAKSMYVNDECDKFVSEFLSGNSTGYRLIYHYSKKPVRPMPNKYKKCWKLDDSDAPTFNYTTAFTFTTWPSMNALNEKLEHPITPDWFRSNILISTDSEEPFQEDEWTGRIKIGNQVIIKYTKPCNRCMDITVNPKTGEKDPAMEPMKTLRKFRLLDPNKNELEALKRKTIGESPLFSVNCSLDTSGYAGIGDNVYVETQ